LAYRRCELILVNGNRMGARFITEPLKKIEALQNADALSGSE
jgi:hypothetical protein